MKKILLFLLPLFLLAQECIVLPSARPCQFNNCAKPLLYTDLDLLYWQAKEEGLEYAISNTANNNNLDASVISPEFEWRFAFRFALGFHLPYDDWDLGIQVTHFDAKSKNDNSSFNLNPPLVSSGQGLIPVWTHPGAFSGDLINVRWQIADSKWKLNYNIIDTKLGRNFCVSSALSINPYFGIKNAIIHQNFSLHYKFANGAAIGPAATDVALKSFSYGVGPLLGLDTKWHASCMWSFFTKFSFSLLHTHFTSERVENDLSTNNNDRAELNEKYWTYKPEVEGAIGINCDICSGKMQHIGISVAYEAQYWFKQNQMIRFIDANIDGKTRNTLGDLLLHGLSVNFRFDF
ncbi:MAG: Lpg1974 family pore-forming outer membrane protein [Chlamydiota bacterium]|jgi:hypothetical protein